MLNSYSFIAYFEKDDINMKVQYWSPPYTLNQDTFTSWLESKQKHLLAPEATMFKKVHTLGVSLDVNHVKVVELNTFLKV